MTKDCSPRPNPRAALLTLLLALLALVCIAPDALAHLFEEFYRARPAKEYAEGSTGLGLPIAQRIATTYRGRIDVRSTVGEGSTFTVTLPLDPVPPAQLNSR